MLYGTVRSNIIQQELVLKVKAVLAKICKEEHHKNVAQSSIVDERGGVGVAFTAIKLLQQYAPTI